MTTLVLTTWTRLLNLQAAESGPLFSVTKLPWRDHENQTFWLCFNETHSLHKAAPSFDNPFPLLGRNKWIPKEAMFLVFSWESLRFQEMFPKKALSHVQKDFALLLLVSQPPNSIHTSTPPLIFPGSPRPSLLPSLPTSCHFSPHRLDRYILLPFSYLIFQQGVFSFSLLLNTWRPIMKMGKTLITPCSPDNPATFFRTSTGISKWVCV